MIAVLTMIVLAVLSVVWVAYVCGPYRLARVRSTRRERLEKLEKDNLMRWDVIMRHGCELERTNADVRGWHTELALRDTKFSNRLGQTEIQMAYVAKTLEYYDERLKKLEAL